MFARMLLLVGDGFGGDFGVPGALGGTIRDAVGAGGLGVDFGVKWGLGGEGGGIGLLGATWSG